MGKVIQFLSIILGLAAGLDLKTISGVKGRIKRSRGDCWVSGSTSDLCWRIKVDNTRLPIKIDARVRPALQPSRKH